MDPHRSFCGKLLTLRVPIETELDNRIAAWSKFHLLKKELTTKSYSLKGRLILFLGTVAHTMLCAPSTWTVTTELQNKIRKKTQ